MRLILRSSWVTAPEAKPLNALSEARRGFKRLGRDLSVWHILSSFIFINTPTSIDNKQFYI